MRRWLAVFALAVLSCTDPTAPDRQLQLAEQRWERLGSPNYDYVFQISAMVFANPTRVEVRGNVIRRVVDVVTGQEQPASRGLTIDAIFARIRSDLQAGRRMEVTYDALGIPTRYLSGTPENDGGYILTTSQYVRR